MPRTKAEDAKRKAEYRRDNPDKVAATQRDNYLRNRDKRLQQKREYYVRNTERIKEYQRAYRARNAALLTEARAKYREDNRVELNNRALFARSGFTSESKKQIIAQQNNSCAICLCDFTEMSARHIHADHCHKTSTPRGVLCGACNLGLGKFKDNPVLLRAAAAYLERHNKEQINA